MNNQLKIPDAETRARNVANWRETIRKIDALTLSLDELIAMVEEHNRRSPLTTYRLNKYQHPVTSEGTKETDSVRAKLGALNVNEQDITDAVEWARQ